MGNMILCGVCVDEKVYNDFALKEYDVPHDFKDGERSLLNIEQMAKMSDYKKHYPEFAKACQKIVEQAAREIKNFYAAKDGRREYKVMRHDDFTGYIKDLQEIHKKAAAERQRIQSEYDKAAEAWREAQKDATLSDYGRTAAKMKWLEAEQAYKDSVEALKCTTNEDIANIRKEFDEHIEDFYSANGNRLDDGTVRLLNSGIKLSDKEIDRLVNQNKGNPTMLRLVHDYCQSKKIENKQARIYGYTAMAAGSHENRIFNQVVDMVSRVLTTEDAIAKVWGKENSHFERLSNDAIQSMAALEVKPEASGE